MLLTLLLVNKSWQLVWPITVVIVVISLLLLLELMELKKRYTDSVKSVRIRQRKELEPFWQIYQMINGHLMILSNWRRVVMIC